MFASQGSVFDARSRGGTSFEAQRPAFPSMRGVGCLSQYPSTEIRSIRIPGAPNKSPEPTTTSVTPRALALFSETKPPTETRLPARLVPAVVVAHLERSAVLRDA
jgi:hypothetical protein